MGENTERLKHLEDEMNARFDRMQEEMDKGFSLMGKTMMTILEKIDNKADLEHRMRLLEDQVYEIQRQQKQQ